MPYRGFQTGWLTVRLVASFKKSNYKNKPGAVGEASERANDKLAAHPSERAA